MGTGKRGEERSESDYKVKSMRFREKNPRNVSKILYESDSLAFSLFNYPVNCLVFSQ